MMRAGYLVKQQHFEGPLDLLLELIEGKKLEVSQVSLAQVTDEYLARVKALPAIDREELAEFLVVAAELMLVKSRSLLPELQLSEDEEMTADELERRLMEYKRLKELAVELRELDQRGVHLFPREGYQGLPVIFYPPPGLGVGEIKAAFASVIAALPQLAKLVEEKIKKVISLEEKIKDIQSRLTAKLEHAFSDLVRGSREKVEVIVSFLAILELAKNKLVLLDQTEHFGDITIRRV